MPDNKMPLTRINLRKIGMNIVLILAGFLVLALATNSLVHAAGKSKAYGMLTSIKDNGTVIIDEKGYLISPSVDVRDYRGDRMSLRDIIPSCFIHFEYEQTTRGFEIFFIQEVPL
jgi:hypothetical protein